MLVGGSKAYRVGRFQNICVFATEASVCPPFDLDALRQRTMAVVVSSVDKVETSQSSSVFTDYLHQGCPVSDIYQKILR